MTPLNTASTTLFKAFTTAMPNVSSTVPLNSSTNPLPNVSAMAPLNKIPIEATETTPDNVSPEINNNIEDNKNDNLLSTIKELPQALQLNAGKALAPNALNSSLGSLAKTVFTPPFNVKNLLRRSSNMFEKR